MEELTSIKQQIPRVVQTTLFIQSGSGAIFSEDARYRYLLWRIWDETKPPVLFIGVNPSTADGEKKDPTLGRMIGFAKDIGFGGIYVANLYAIVSKIPEIIRKIDDPIGPENDTFLKQKASEGIAVIFCWGSFPWISDRANRVQEMFSDPYCLGCNSDGSPKHPLYLPAATKPERFFGKYMGRLVKRKLTFHNTKDGDFWSMYDAFAWLSDNGYGHGSTCAQEPTAITKGSYAESGLPQKWKNFNQFDKDNVIGVLTGDNRNGPVYVHLFE